MPLPLKPIDIHTHPFTEETVYGHGPSFTEAILAEVLGLDAGGIERLRAFGAVGGRAET